MLIGEVRVVDDVPGAFVEVVAEAWAARAEKVFSLALSGGNTARRCYERLAGADGPVDWMRTDVYWGDERCVPADDADANQRLVREALLERVGGANARYPMQCGPGGDDDYQLRLAALGGIDCIHLGLGADGHTASLFPGSAALDADEGRYVVHNEDPTGTHPHQRMTLTFAGIALGRTVVVTAEGERKADAVAAVAAGDDVPAARIRGDRVIWLIDPAAAATAGL